MKKCGLQNASMVGKEIRLVRRCLHWSMCGQRTSVCFPQTKHRERKLAMNLLKGTLPKSTKRSLNYKGTPCRILKTGACRGSIMS